jgi:hypothetical protein
MSDRRDTILNIDREPPTRIYNDGGGSGLLAGVLIVLLLIGLFALIYFRPADTVAPAAPNVTIENPAPVVPAPAPEPATPAPETPAPVTP